MTNEQFYDLCSMGRKIAAFEKAMLNYRAMVEARADIAKNIRAKYPNMRIEAIRETMWKQEEQFRLAAQVEYNEAWVCANSLGISLPSIVVENDVVGILRKDIIEIRNINV